MGKVYACSDIHANLKQFESLLSFINEDDKLYVIGDVVDKGPDKLAVLDKIMNDKRITFLMGNHDLMMFCVVKYIDDPEVIDTRYYEGVYDNWIKYNQGQKTLNAFLNQDEEKKKEILDYLENSPILLNIKVEDKDYILVHAYPENMGEKDVYMEDLKLDKLNGLYNWASDYVWRRDAFLHIDNKILITGHTPTAYYDSCKIVGDGKWYDLDCNLATLRENGTLGVLCLNDLKEYYF